MKLFNLILFLVLSVLFLCPMASVAADANRMQFLQLYAPGTDLALTSSAVDVSDYKGNAAFAAQFSPTAVACTSTVTLAHCTTSGGTYTTVTNLAGTACVITQTGPATNDIQTVPIDLARLHVYAKVIVSQSGQDTNAISAFLIAPMKAD